MAISVLSFILLDRDTDDLTYLMPSEFQIAPQNSHPLGRAAIDLMPTQPVLLTEGLHTGVELA